MEAKKAFWASVWAGFQELEFITACFTWLFLFLSRMAEPLMTLSALYMIVQTGVASLHVDAIYNTATASMIGAPEIILPGAFVLAGKEHSNGRKGRAGVLFTMAALFVGLTLITLADLFMWHLRSNDPNFQLIMFARCAVSVGYSIIFRVITHKDEKTNGQPNDLPGLPQVAPKNPPVNPPTGTPQKPPVSTPANTTGNAPKNPPVEPPKHTTENPPTGTPNHPPKTRQEARQKADTKQRVEAYRRRHPNATQDAIARALNVSLRTVQRYDTGGDGPRLHVV
jgi:hypothetical protein